MKKSYLVAVLFILPFLLAAQQSTYSRVKIYTDHKTPAQLFETGIEILGGDSGDQGYIAEISQQEIARVSAMGFRCEVIIPDMAKFYAGRFHEKSALTSEDILISQQWPQPFNFSLGSCGGFSTVDQMNAQLDLMHSLYPSLITVKHALSDTLTTVEGRNIYYVRISDNPNVNEAEPEVLYTGMHHAREPIGMQHLLYYMWYLLENYDSDPAIKDLVDNTEMYFVPVFNVDGYAFNIAEYPDGGGSWRKNRRMNDDGTYGIDLNRNYGYKWGYDNSGSSPTPESEVFRGPAAFSEPETRMMKHFCESHNFLIALNYHSYANLLLSPWGWTQEPCADSSLFDAYAYELTQESEYNYGPGSTTIYPTNGGSDDWMYGEQTTKPAILSYTPEVGNSWDGFWPGQDRILPLIQQNMLTSITAARLTGKYATITDQSPLFIWQKSGYLPFEVKRLGMKEGSFTVSVSPLGNSFATISGSRIIEGLVLLGQHTDSISYELSQSLQPGDTVRYILHVSNGTLSLSDTVTRIFGYSFTVINDNLDDNSHWTGTWALTDKQFFSASSCMTDSPEGNYSGSDNKTIALGTSIALPNAVMAVLQFRAKWTLEEDFDYVQVSISDNDGASWYPLQGKYSHSGTNFQAAGTPVYEGRKGEWVREAISLNPYMGKNIKLRFKLKADYGKQFDGFYYDDFNISIIPITTGVPDANNSMAFLGNPYPNPATNRVEISYLLPAIAAKAELQLLTPAGIIVSRTILGQQSGNSGIDIGSLAPGIYFARMVSAGIQSPVRKLIVE